jgi:LacI family transcriptional regulator
MDMKMKRAGHDRKPIRRVLLLLDWYSRAYHSGVARYAREAGWVLNAHSAHIRAGEFIPDWRGDGILAMVHNEEPTGEFCREAKVPVVDLAWQCPGIGLPRVLYDNHAHGRLAAEHFIQRGFRHFAFRGEKNPLWSEEERFAGFSTCLSDHGYHCHRLRWDGAGRRSRPTPRRHRQALADALRELPTPLAVMAHNDDCGVVVIDACLDAGLLVPEQVAVVACDNDELICNFAPAPLSSVDPDLERQAYEAARLLGRLMDGKRPPRKPIRTPPKGVVVRQSSDIMAVEHVEVAKALRFIWQHYGDALMGVDDVVGATTLSKTGLNKAFQRHLNRPIGEEIRLVRIERAKALLRDTPRKSVAAIAAACGYGSDKHLRDSLRRYEGMPPSDWRQQT